MTNTNDRVQMQIFEGERIFQNDKLFEKLKYTPQAPVVIVLITILRVLMIIKNEIQDAKTKKTP